MAFLYLCSEIPLFLGFSTFAPCSMHPKHHPVNVRYEANFHSSLKPYTQNEPLCKFETIIDLRQKVQHVLKMYPPPNKAINETDTVGGVSVFISHLEIIAKIIFLTTQSRKLSSLTVKRLYDSPLGKEQLVRRLDFSMLQFQSDCLLDRQQNSCVIPRDRF